MRILVQKFGGTSVATAAARRQAVQKIKQALREGYAPVVVVSAMGRQGDPYATDTLLGLVRQEGRQVAAREMDQLMCCGEMISAVVMTSLLQSEGLAAVMLTGGQAGIQTDEQFNQARILQVETKRLRQLLASGQVPVVCGFQGITANGEMTTLGRGGSDTTAAALGAALEAEMVEIYTDVDGIMTADPRLVDDAKILDCVSYGEICQLAHQGAKVIHPRAVEIAMQKNVPLVVKSTFSDAPGTLITSQGNQQQGGTDIVDRVATGVTFLAGIAQVRVDLAAGTPAGANVSVFQAMAENGISVDLINVHPGQIMFTIKEDCCEQALAQLTAVGYPAVVQNDCAKVSVVGGGMRGVPGVMASFIGALSEQAIPILQTVDSHTSISALIPRAHVQQAMTALHSAFQLAK